MIKISCCRIRGWGLDSPRGEEPTWSALCKLHSHRIPPGEEENVNHVYVFHTQRALERVTISRNPLDGTQLIYLDVYKGGKGENYHPPLEITSLLDLTQYSPLSIIRTFLNLLHSKLQGFYSATEIKGSALVVQRNSSLLFCILLDAFHTRQEMSSCKKKKKIQRVQRSSSSSSQSQPGGGQCFRHFSCYTNSVLISFSSTHCTRT